MVSEGLDTGKLSLYLTWHELCLRDKLRVEVSHIRSSPGSRVATKPARSLTAPYSTAGYCSDTWRRVIVFLTV